MTRPDDSKKADGRSSEPSSPVATTLPRLSPLRNSATTRSRSLSPRKQTANQPLHIRMNLTETQMDKITDAFSQKVNGSALRRSKAATNIPFDMPDHRNSLTRTPKMAILPNSDHIGMDEMSPTFSALMPVIQDDSLAERRQKTPLPPIDILSAPNSVSKPRRAQMESVDAEVSPLSAARQSHSAKCNRPVSSTYSMETGPLQPPRPLNLRHSRISRQANDGDTLTTDIYDSWSNIYSSGVSPGPSPNRQTLSQHPRRSKSNVEGLRQWRSPTKVPPVPELVKGVRGPPVPAVESPLFSPLAMYFRSHDFPTAKRGEKILIGDNGWLERTEHKMAPVGNSKKTPQKKPGILNSIKRMARDMTELHASRHFGEHATAWSRVQLAISLSAREQSLLYCELEYHLASALNSYISAELDKGHLVPQSFKKIADAWCDLGRPRVVGFRFDLETQIDLVSLHINEFTFHGRRRCNPLEISSLLQTMKVNSRAMRVRTFCQPDVVIAKQLVDAKSLFDMIGVPANVQVALAEIVQFFKVIIEREQDNREVRQEDAAGCGEGTNSAHWDPRVENAEPKKRGHVGIGDSAINTLLNKFS